MNEGIVLFTGAGAWIVFIALLPYFCATSVDLEALKFQKLWLIFLSA
jgi:hypothetical protein